MNAWKAIAAGLLAGLLGAVSTGHAAGPPKLSGTIVGFVGDSTGIPQMGATVFLFNRFDRLVLKTTTDEKGAFGFDFLLPDTYSLRVRLPSFVPAIKRNIVIAPGTRSFLSINLASIFSTVELIYSTPGSAIMSDDWRWVLRSSMATRPVLRVLPEYGSKAEAQRSWTLFSDTRGLLNVSAGDAAPATGFTSSPDLGTSFALATSLFGANTLHFSGNLGFSSQTGTPAAGFRTRFSRGEAGGITPNIELTMRQLLLPVNLGSNLPVLRTMSLAFQDRAKLTDELMFEYGMTLETVSFLDRLNYMSPYARVSYRIGAGQVEFGYSSGLPPVDLLAANASPDADLQRDLAGVAMFPRVTLKDGRARVQRAQNFEAGYSHKAGSRSVSIAAYHENLTNAALTMTSDGMLPAATDLLPDLFSSSSIFNIGDYSTVGFLASVTQEVTEDLSISLGFGNGGVLRTEERTLSSGSPDELRSMVHSARRNWAVAKVSGTAPGTGTRFSSSYMWTDYRSLTPGHFYLTQSLRPETGLNIYLRQPVPFINGGRGRLEATAELRNLLAQGYLPISTGDGRRLVLIHSPRSVRGGFSFIF